MATFNGLDLGVVESFDGGPAAYEFQVNSYPGISGRERLRMGARGFDWELHCVAYSNSFAGFATLVNSYQQMQANAVSGVFVDPNGQTWLNVTCTRMEFGGPRTQLPGGGVAQRYTAGFAYDGT